MTDSTRRAFVLLFALASVAEAGWYRVVGPSEFLRSPGPWIWESESFEVEDPTIPYLIRIHNGGHRGDLGRVSSGVVRLNGVRIFGPVEFRDDRPALLQKRVTLQRRNTLAVRLSGHRGGITLLVLGRDDVQPQITARVEPAANAAGWHKDTVTVVFDCLDGLSGIESCSAPEVVSSEGENQVVTGTAVDAAGNVATASALISLDLTPPVIEVDEPQNGDAVNGIDFRTVGSITDDLSGVASANVETDATSVALSLSATGGFAQSIDLGGDPGPRTLAYSAEDVAGNPALPAEVGVEVLAEAPVSLEVLSPGEKTIQYNSGWPLTLRVTMPPDFLGIGVVPGNVSDDDQRVGPFPRRDQQGGGFFVLEDGDSCPSFVTTGGLDNGRAPQVCPGLPPVFYNDQELICPDDPSTEGEVLIHVRPGLDPVGDRERFPALVLLSDTGLGVTEVDGVVEAKNLAYWNSVAYELKDGRGRTSITAHMNVPFGRFAPIVEFEILDIENPDVEVYTGRARYRVDGGAACPDGGPGPVCEVARVEYDYSCTDDPELAEGRMTDLYVPVFQAKEVTLRAFVLALPAGQSAPDKIRDTAPFDRVVDISDAIQEPLSRQVEIKFSQRYGAPCAGFGRPSVSGPECDQREPCELLKPDPETSDFDPRVTSFCDVDGIPDSSPVGTSEPPKK